MSTFRHFYRPFNSTLLSDKSWMGCSTLMIFSPTLSDVPTCSGISTYKDKQCSFCKVRIMIITIIISVMSHFPRPDCRVDIFRCKTNIWVAVCIADAVQTASLFPRSEARPALRPTLPTYSLHSQGFYLILCMNLLWIRWHIRQIKFFAPNMKTFWLFNGWFLFLPVNSVN